MNDMHNLITGFNVLSCYGGTGEVSNNLKKRLFAGPGDLTEDQYSPRDRNKLHDADWEFDTTVQRWGYELQ